MKKAIAAWLTGLALACASAEAHAQATQDALDALSTMQTFLHDSVWGCKPEVLNRRPMPNVRVETLKVTGRTFSFACGNPSDQGDQDYRYRYADYPSPWFANVAGGLHLCLQQDKKCRENLKIYSAVRNQADVQQGLLLAWRTLSRPRGVADPAIDPSMRVAGVTDQEQRRRVQVQAQLALRDNRNMDAARLYRDALRTAPAWADGHYNLGLLYGDLELYPEAITEMRRYLFLTPSAQDARAVQDKIYEWEASTAAP